jgi:Uma2 family endonuclease
MDAKKLAYHTIEDIYNLPEGERAELIDGQIYYMASPGRRHQAVLGALFSQIYNHIRTKKGACEVYPAPFAVFLHDDEYTYLEPDITVICDPRKLDDKGCHGAPDLIIEIISPGTSSHDYLRKYALYKKAGVREYWIVNPLDKEVAVCTFSGQEPDPARYSFSDQVKVGIFEDLTIDFGELEIS